MIEYQNTIGQGAECEGAPPATRALHIEICNRIDLASIGYYSNHWRYTFRSKIGIEVWCLGGFWFFPTACISAKLSHPIKAVF